MTKLPFHLCLLCTGTLLTLSPVIYKLVTTIMLAMVIMKEHRAEMHVGPVEPFLGLCMVSGIAMILIAIISNARSKTEK